MKKVKSILVSFFSFLLVFSALSCGYLPPEKAELYDPKNHPDHQIDLTSETAVTELYQVMKDMHEIFGQCKVPYFADSGTLLGAIRNRGVIPWDDDHDLGVLVKDLPKILILRPLLADLGYRIQEVFFGYKIIRTTGTQPTIDIFAMKEENGRYSYARDTWGKREVRDSVTGKTKKVDIFITKEELYPLKEVNYGPIHIMVPHNPIPYLDAYYRGWPDVAYTYGHSGQRKFKIDLKEHSIFKEPAPIDLNSLQAIDVSSKLIDHVPAHLKCPELKIENIQEHPQFHDPI